MSSLLDHVARAYKASRQLPNAINKDPKSSAEKFFTDNPVI